MHSIKSVILAGAALIAGAGLAIPFAPADAQAQVANPADTLKESLQTLSAEPTDFDALLRAGYASVALGDLQAAGGFFGRAADLRPDDPRPQAGMGAAMAQAGDAQRALTYFAAAEARGANAAQFGVDRGLAHDLMGNLKAAEADYRAGLGRDRDADARRRLALNLAMQGERTAAIAFLQPLLNAGDPAAQRSRAFVLALTGDLDGARRAIDYAMPGASAQIDPFLRRLPVLSNGEKAAAVHLGRFPSSGTQARNEPPRPSAPQRVAQSSSPPPPPTNPPSTSRRESTAQSGSRSRNRRASNLSTTSPAQAAAERRRARAARRAERNPAYDLASRPASRPSSPPTAPAPAQAEPPVAREQAPPSAPMAVDRKVETFDLPSAQAQNSAPDNGPEERLAGIDAVLRSTAPSRDEAPLGRAARASPPPAPQPKFEPPPAPSPKVEASRPKIERSAPDIGVEGTHWVQIAGGRKDAMDFEWRRLKRAADGALDGKEGYVTQGVDFFRLLVGPYRNAREAQEMVNQLKANGVDSFAWRRNPALIKIEKL